MGAMIKAVKFDMLFIQFYNTPICSAAAWAAANPSYTIGSVPHGSGFTFDAWVSWLAANTASSGAKIYIGLPGSSAAVSTSSQYINQVHAQDMLEAFYCRPSFGGVAIWEATYAEGNLYYGQTLYMWMKRALIGASVSWALQTCPVSRLAAV